VYPHLSVFSFSSVNFMVDFPHKLNLQHSEAIDRPPTLNELIARITPENLHKGAWHEDGPVGNEAW
jgi:antitoxin component of MazEF toxin-antitoxin module